MPLPFGRGFSLCRRERDVALQTTVVGSYPKPPDEGSPFKVRQTLHALERGEAEPDELRRAQDELVAEIVREQQEAGIDIVTDGHARWDDILTPFARNIAGFEIGGLLRWFDNNVYYRRPVCTAALEWRGPSSVEAFRFAQSVSDRPVKAVIPGPVTFALLSVDEHYGDVERFATAIATILAQEAFELEAAGAGFIQIDEPALLEAPELLDVAQRTIERTTGEIRSAEVTLATYFGDAKRLGTDLFRLPVPAYAFDFVAGPENMELLRQAPGGTTIQAGVLDARNTRLEPVDDVARTLSTLLDSVDAGSLRLAPSAGLEFLPREKARAKLHRLTEIAGKVGA
jgi:5-methyltetrahydropteroyltriglutamate--homocysteine methyltransferase